MRRMRSSWMILVLCLVANPWTVAARSPRSDLTYEIFVRSFCDGDGDPRGIGDLQGIISKLDSYLNDGNPETHHDLGVGMLWLTPIFPSSSYHGYDVDHYRAIHPDFGTLDDLRQLIREAHHRGVRVILDVPFNHSSDTHPWFKEAVADPNSPKRKYYKFKSGHSRERGWHLATAPSGEKLSYFGLFSPRMPDLDFANPEVRAEAKAIAHYWLHMGVDGFRLDAAKHIFGDTFGKLSQDEIHRNNAWWQEFSTDVYRTKPDTVLMGEVLGERDVLEQHSLSLDGLIDEPFLVDLRQQVDRPRPGFLARQKSFLEKARAINRSAYVSPQPFADLPFRPFEFVGSHDRNPRLASELDDRRKNGMPHEVEDAARLAAYILLLYSDRPILYAGDELMQRGWKWNGNSKFATQNPGDGSGIYDETLREPFPWFKSGIGAGQTRWFSSRFDDPDDGVSLEEEDHAGSVFDTIRALMQLRTRYPLLAQGDIGRIVQDSGDLMVFERVTGPNRYLVLINTTRSPKTFESQEKRGPGDVQARLIFEADGVKKNDRVLNIPAERAITIPGFGVVVIEKTR